MGDQNNQRRLKVALGAIIVLILLLLGSCGLRKLFDSGKLDNSMTVTEVQENNPSSYLPYSDKEQFVDFIGAENGEGEITYEIVKAVDENNKKVSYFTLKDDKTTQIRVAPNTPAGTYLVTIKAKASGDETHKAADLEFTVKIRIGGKKDGSFDVLPTAKDGLLYTGNSMDLINPGSSSSGTIYYKVNDGEWSTSIPQGKEAGIYTVYYKLVGDSSHNDVPERSFIVEIKSPSSSGSNKNTKPSGSGSSSQGGSGSGGDTPSGGGGGGQVDYNVGSKPTSKTVTYNGKKQSIDYSTPAHVNVSGEAAGTNAGTYTATYTPESGYYWSDGSSSAVTVTLTINRESVGEKPSDKTVTYDGKYHCLDYAKPSTVDVSGAAEGTNVGKYTATYTPKENYCWSDGSTAPVTATLTINRASVGDKPQSKSVEYNDSTQSIDYKAPSTVNVKGKASGKKVGKYSATYTPKENYCWSDGSTGSVTATLTITRASVGDKPTSKTVTYNGKTQSIDYKAPNTVKVKGSASGTNAGNYSATYTPKENYCWSDGTTGSVKATLTINRASVGDKPESKTVDYNGKTQSIDYDAPNTVRVKGKASGKDAGAYTATYTPKDNYCWSDGATSSVKATLTIKKLSVGDKPADKTVDYNGQTQSIDYDKPETVYVRGKASGIEVGTYSAYYTPKKNYCWSDGTSSTVKATLTIKSSGIERPTNTSVTTTFNGRTQTNGYDKPDGIDMSGKDRGRNAGTYTAEYTPDENHTWSDGKRDTVTVTLTIEKQQLDSPYIDGKDTFVYDRKYHKVDVDGYDPVLVKLSGNTGIKKNVGKYSITASIIDKVNYEWKEDPKDEDRVLEWSITAKKLAVPAVKTEFVYNGKVQRAKEKDLDENYDRYLMDVIKHGGGVNAGDYEMVIRLTNTKDYVWEDGTTDNQTITWTIKKAENPIYVIDDQTIDTIYYASDNSVFFKPATRAKGEVTYELVSAEKRNSRSLALGEKFVVSGNEITIKGGTEEGVYDLVVKATAAGDSNYDVGEKEIKITLTISVSTIDKPTDLAVSTTYNGKVQTNGYDKPDGVVMTGDDRGKNAGEYSATYTPDENHVWSDGTREQVTVVLTIDRQKLDLPYFDGESTFVYDGDYHRADVDGYNPLLVDLSGDTWYKKHTGNYEITASIRDKVNYEWEKDPDEDKVLEWSITAKKLAVPEVVTEFVYDGKVHMAKEGDLNEDYDKSLMKVVTHTGGTEAGRYFMEISLRNTKDCVWEDGTTDVKRIYWEIKKAENPMHVVDPQANATIYNPLDHEVLFAPATKAVGDVTYTLTSAKEHDTDTRESFELTENNSIKIKGDTANGAYDLVINVKATGNNNYSEAEKDIHLKLTIAGIRYVVKFDGNGATSGEMDYQDFYGTVIKKHLNSNEYEREGYYFAGWNTKSDGTGDYFSDRVFIDYRDIAPYAESGITTLYAQWSAKTLKITYDLDGGEFADDIEVPYEFTAETESFTLPQPTKHGYSFAGWTGTDLTEETLRVVVSKGTTTDRAYKANWTANSYYVLYIDEKSLLPDLKGGFTYGEPFGSNLKSLNYEGYESYWYTIPDTGFDVLDYLGTKVTSDTIVDDTWTGLIMDQLTEYLSEKGFGWIIDILPNNTIILFARHTPYTNTPFTVKHYVQKLYSTDYELLNGKETETRFGTTDEPIEYENQALNIYGFHFAKGTFENGRDNEPTVKADGSSVINIYYDRNEYKVTFDSKGGNDIATQMVPYEGFAKEPEDPTRSDGHVFREWYYMGLPYEFDTRVVEDIALVAQWDECVEINAFTEDYDLGDTSGSGKYKLGETVVLTAKPNEDCRFVEWRKDGQVVSKYSILSFDVTEEMITEGEIEYVAVFEKIDSSSLVNYEEYTYKVYAGEEINITELFKTALIRSYDAETGKDSPLTFDRDGLIFEKVSIKVDEEAKSGAYKMTVTVKPHVVDHYHEISTVDITVIVLDHTCTVTFDSNGGSDVSNQEVVIGETIDVVKAKTNREGYTFLYWCDLESGEVFDLNTPINEPVNLIAKWAHKVTFDLNGGSSEEGLVQYVEDGTTATRPADPKREGFMFEGWYLNDELFSFNTPITDNITLTAGWINKDYRKIRTSVNDETMGVVTGGGIYEIGYSATLRAIPNDGYKFIRWSDGNTDNPRYIEITEDVQCDYEAEFSRLSETLFSTAYIEYKNYKPRDSKSIARDIFENNGANVINVKSYKVEYETPNSPVTYSMNGFLVYLDARISVDRKAKPGIYRMRVTANSILGGETESITIVVHVVENVYDVTFDSKGGSSVPKQSVGKGEFATEPAAPKYPGYTFVGWYDKATNEPFDFEHTPINGKTQLYAVWKDANSVIFHSEGGSDVETQYVETGKFATRPTDPKRKGYALIGWYLEDATEPFDFASTPISGETNLYARWAEVHTVTFYSSYGNVYDEQLVPDGSLMNRPADPRSTGYDFTGWIQVIGEEGVEFDDFDKPVTSDMELYADWDEMHQFTVYYELSGKEIEPKSDVYWNQNGLIPEGTPTRLGFRFAGWYLDSEHTVSYNNQTYGEVAGYDDRLQSVTLYGAWYRIDITDYKTSFTSIAGEEASFEIKNSDHWYMLYFEYEIISGNDSDMFRMSADKNHVIISPLAEPGTYYITVSSQSLIPIEQLDGIQTLLIEWTVEPEPEPTPVEPESGETEQPDGLPVDGQSGIDGTDGQEVEGGNRDAETPAPQAVNPEVFAMPGETPTIKPEGDEENIPQVEKEPEETDTTGTVIDGQKPEEEKTESSEGE